MIYCTPVRFSCTRLAVCAAASSLAGVAYADVSASLSLEPVIEPAAWPWQQTLNTETFASASEWSSVLSAHQPGDADETAGDDDLAFIEGESGGALSADELARELSNPNSSLAQLSLKLTYTRFDGDLPGASGENALTLLFQPTFPFKAGETPFGGDATIFFRPAIPLLLGQPAPQLLDQPVFDQTNTDFTDETGLGDIGFDIAYGGTEEGGLLWALGAVGSLPTATHRNLGAREFTFGPEALLAKFEKWGLIGVFPSHQWNVAGWNDEDISISRMQVFLVGLLEDGWGVGTTPQMAYDWNTEDFTIPLNLTISKSVAGGSVPIKYALGIDYYVSKADAFGPDWAISFTVTPVVENIFESWFR